MFVLDLVKGVILGGGIAGHCGRDTICCMVSVVELSLSLLALQGGHVFVMQVTKSVLHIAPGAGEGLSRIDIRVLPDLAGKFCPAKS